MPFDGNSVSDKRRWLLFVCVLAAVTHGLFYLYRPDTTPGPDAREYSALGIGLAETGELRLPTGEVAKRMPLYPALIAAVYRWQGPDVWQNGVLLVQTLLAWCSTIIIALTAERLADGRAAWMAGTTAALYSPFRYLQMSILTETLLIFLGSLALFLYIAIGLRTRSTTTKSWSGDCGTTALPVGTQAGRPCHGIEIVPKWAGLIAVSLLIGLGALTRPNALLLILPFAIDTACRTGRATERAGRVALILVPALVCACCWGVRNERATGAFTLSTTGGLNFYLGHNSNYARDAGAGGDTDYGAFDRLRHEEWLSEVEADRRLFHEGLAFIAAHPWQTVVNGLRKLGVWLRPSVPQHGPLTLVLGFGALVACGWPRRCLPQRPARRPAVSPRTVYVLAFIALVGLTAWLAVVLSQVSLPLTTPLFVVPIGLIALLLLRSTPNVRGLLIGLFATQLAVAVVFLPLARIRWAVDGILIVAIGVGISRLCRWLCAPPPGATSLPVVTAKPPNSVTPL
ncbi:MAG: hypothetical protein JXQ75_08950 [Phycisphaerae bacterium]|nr:hypothetical protein [Phycisphaerae bacterium]